MLGSQCRAQASWGAVQGTRVQQEQTLREGFSKREAARLLHLLLLQQPLLACASDGSWLPRNFGVGGAARTGSSNTCISETLRRERTQLNCTSFLHNEEV